MKTWRLIKEARSNFSQLQPNSFMKIFKCGFWGWILSLCFIVIPLNEEREFFSLMSFLSLTILKTRSCSRKIRLSDSKIKPSRAQTPRYETPNKTFLMNTCLLIFFAHFLSHWHYFAVMDILCSTFYHTLACFFVFLLKNYFFSIHCPLGVRSGVGGGACCRMRTIYLQADSTVLRIRLQNVFLSLGTRNVSTDSFSLLTRWTVSSISTHARVGHITNPIRYGCRRAVHHQNPLVDLLNWFRKNCRIQWRL